jgi:hypothetical protein
VRDSESSLLQELLDADTHRFRHLHRALPEPQGAVPPFMVDECDARVSVLLVADTRHAQAPFPPDLLRFRYASMSSMA